MYVNEIFQSIEGEGKRAGSLATFIRLCGCNLRCSYCDTKYAFTTEGARDMSPLDIMREVHVKGIGNYVTVTGGEPLIHKDIEQLLSLLMQYGYEVNVETNGTCEPPFESSENLFYTMDFKSPSSGERASMNWDAMKALTERDVLKFVVGSKRDLDDARDALERLDPVAQVYFSPVFGKIEPREIVEYMQEHKMFGCKVQLQLHKFIWDPMKRGV